MGPPAFGKLPALWPTWPKIHGTGRRLKALGWMQSAERFEVTGLGMSWAQTHVQDPRMTGLRFRGFSHSGNFGMMREFWEHGLGELLRAFGDGELSGSGSKSLS